MQRRREVVAGDADELRLPLHADDCHARSRRPRSPTEQYHEPPDELPAGDADEGADPGLSDRGGRGDQLVRAAHLASSRDGGGRRRSCATRSRRSSSTSRLDHRVPAAAHGPSGASTVEGRCSSPRATSSSSARKRRKPRTTSLARGCGHARHDRGEARWLQRAARPGAARRHREGGREAPRAGQAARARAAREAARPGLVRRARPLRPPPRGRVRDARAAARTATPSSPATARSSAARSSSSRRTSPSSAARSARSSPRRSAR